MLRPLLCLTLALLASASPLAAQDADEQRDVILRLIERITDDAGRRGAGAVDFTNNAVGASDRAAATFIRRRLELQRVSLNFDELALFDAVEFLRQVTDLNIVVSPRARQRVIDSGRTVSLKLRDVRLRNALVLCLRAIDAELAFGVRYGVLYIGERAELRRSTMRVGVYDLGELIHERKDFPAPRLGLPGEDDATTP
jgi:hypothetical protein